MNKTGLKAAIKVFSIDFSIIDTNDVLDMHKHLMKETWCKIMSELIKKIFMGSLTGIVSALIIESACR